VAGAAVLRPVLGAGQIEADAAGASVSAAATAAAANRAVVTAEA